jgi:hypothetical protein
MAKKSLKRKLLFPIILALSTLLGGFVAVFALLPRISVTPSDPVDTVNPFSASFTISNTNFIPLNDVNVSIGLGQIATLPRQFNPDFIPSFKTLMTRPDWNNHILDIDERFTITATDMFHLEPDARLTGADIAVVVSY